jgi:nitroreductase
MNSDQIIKQIFENGRTHRFFTDKPISESVLYQLYDMAKIAPSASNLCPMRITFVVSKEQKQKVIETAADGNKSKIESAPVVAIIAHDSKFYDHVEILAPHMDAEAFRRKDKTELEKIATENSWLQAGFLIAAARALGLDCGPMSGFDKEKIDDFIYSNSSWRSNFLMNLGYGDESKLHPRGHRLSFREGCAII